MELTLSKRLLASADMVPQGAYVADVGCDHGYLGIYLLLHGIADHVTATDLRQMPLEAGRANAARYGVADRMDFVCAYGLDGIDPRSVDTLVCAGMGGDLVRMILEKAPWVKNPAYTLILQPQSGIPDFRIWLGEQGFTAEEEQAVREDGHVYASMKVRYTGERSACTPGEAFVSKVLLASRGKDVPAYIDAMLRSVLMALSGLRKAKEPGDKLLFFEQAYEELRKMREQYGNGS